jgi:AAA15 family ATPase/GTPase
MLIECRVQNFKSFNSEQVLNLVSSSATRENYNDENVISFNKFGVGSVLKSAAIFGPNAAGKSNFADALHSLKTIVLFSLRHIDQDLVIATMPFAIKHDYYDIPTEHEVTFVVNDVLYRYGISIVERLISEEWLYQTVSTRETLLFHRQGQKIEFNQRSFSEAKQFVKKEVDEYWVQQTKENIPFISVLAQFQGKISSQVIDWFSGLNIITGVSDDGVKEFTINLYQDDEDFKKWALNILSSMQVQGVEVVEEEEAFPVKDASKFPELMEVAEKLGSFLKNNPIKNKKLRIVKELDGQGYVLPIELESDGTKRIIYFLGVLYDTIKNNKVLIVDEFDSKLHSLLSEYLIGLFHRSSEHRSQMIVTCHDTNLLNRQIFRRDQIWFVDKNDRHESELYSLLEYKEYYTRKDNNYNKDYLAGKYGAIPLFSSVEQFEEVCRSE